jgi:hypothetical protein
MDHHSWSEERLPFLEWVVSRGCLSGGGLDILDAGGHELPGGLYGRDDRFPPIRGPKAVLTMGCLGASGLLLACHETRRYPAAAAAARSPLTTALSSVAGNPVSVQSPARNRFAMGVRTPSRRGCSSGVAANVA